MLEMAGEDSEWRDELEASLDRLGREIALLQEQALFTGEFDAGPAVVTVHAGAGGTDSQDWAEMLLRMYLRWAEGRGFKAELMEATPGEEAGLKSGTFTLTGENAYGIMQAEKGVHRLVRLSPFDSAHRRHTSFAQVEVSPLVEDDVELEIDESDLRIDTYRSQGAGGQHVNKTDSAVRHDAPAHRDRRPVPERALAAAEQGSGDADPQEPPDRARRRATTSKRWRKSAVRRRTFPSEVKSVPTCCTLIRWSTTIART